MVQYHRITHTKSSGTGGKKVQSKDKRLAQYGGFFSRTKFEKDAKAEVRELKRVTAGNYKIIPKLVLFANVVTAPGKIQKTKITNVMESKDNRHYARENIITKGCLIETELGKAVVTSRPGQHGVINARLAK